VLAVSDIPLQEEALERHEKAPQQAWLRRCPRRHDEGEAQARLALDPERELLGVAVGTQAFEQQRDGERLHSGAMSCGARCRYLVAWRFARMSAYTRSACASDTPSARASAAALASWLSAHSARSILSQGRPK